MVCSFSGSLKSGELPKKCWVCQAARTTAVLRILRESFAGRQRLPEKYVGVQIGADGLRGQAVAQPNGEACSEEARMVAELFGRWRK